MSRTVILAYNGSDNTYYRVLCSSYTGKFGYLVIKPSTRTLGVSLGSNFQETSYIVSNSTWLSFACTVSPSEVRVYAQGSLQGIFKPSPDLTNYEPDRIGNLAINELLITAGLAPSPSLAPSNSLAPSSSTYSAQAQANGIIDEVLVFDSVLSDAEIYELSQKSTLYEALPSTPLQDNYTESKVPSTISTTIDLGKVVQRYRYASVPGSRTLTYFLSNIQKQELQDFYKRQTYFGASAFNWTDPLTSETWECRFVSPPSYSRRLNGWTASINQELLP